MMAGNDFFIESLNRLLQILPHKALSEIVQIHKFPLERTKKGITILDLVCDCEPPICKSRSEAKQELRSSGGWSLRVLCHGKIVRK